MPDYSEAAEDALSSLNDAVAGGMVEEYQIGNRRVRRGSAVEQVKAAAMLNALNARQNGGLFRIAKFQEPK